jgi:hypothetical protein
MNTIKEKRKRFREEFERIKGEEYVKWIESQETYTPMEWVDCLSKNG